MYDVITVGSSTIDVFASVESELIKIKTMHHEEELIAYPSGSKILINQLDFLIGGGGTNTAVSFSRLGLKVAYLGKVGSGSNGALILKRLKKDNVIFIGSRSKNLHSGYSVVLDSLEGDRTILTYKGANDAFRFKEINKSKLKTKWFYFSSMVGESYVALEQLAKYAKENNIKIAFNPSNYLAEKGAEYLRHLLGFCTALILNREEAALIVGDHAIGKQLQLLYEFGPQYVVITDGKQGAYTRKDKKVLHAIPPVVSCTESTGAGDAFASTFIMALIRKKSIEDAMAMGMHNAASVITQKGAKNGLLTYRSLTSRLRKSKIKMKYMKPTG